MPSLIDLRRRIRSVKNTQQITKAMKMVSAAKLRRAQDRVIASRPYTNLLRSMLSDVAAAASGVDEIQNELLAVRPEKNVLLILVTGEKGLAGAFNTNLIKAAQQFIRSRQGVNVHLELVGKKGRDFFRRRHDRITGESVGVLANVRYEDAARIAAGAMERFRNEEIDAVYVIFNEFKSVISQKLTESRILPASVPTATAARDYIYEQPPAELLAKLLPKWVEIAVFQSMLESSAAEHAARMTAMDAATSNAAEVIDSLTLYMNRVRQASITKEIIEVVSGAAAQG